MMAAAGRYPPLLTMGGSSGRTSTHSQRHACRLSAATAVAEISAAYALQVRTELHTHRHIRQPTVQPHWHPGQAMQEALGWWCSHAPAHTHSPYVHATWLQFRAWIPHPGRQHGRNTLDNSTSGVPAVQYTNTPCIHASAHKSCARCAPKMDLRGTCMHACMCMNACWHCNVHAHTHVVHVLRSPCRRTATPLPQGNPRAGSSQSLAALPPPPPCRPAAAAGAWAAQARGTRRQSRCGWHALRHPLPRCAPCHRRHRHPHHASPPRPPPAATPLPGGATLLRPWRLPPGGLRSRAAPKTAPRGSQTGRPQSHTCGEGAARWRRWRVCVCACDGRRCSCNGPEPLSLCDASIASSGLACSACGSPDARAVAQRLLAVACRRDRWRQQAACKRCGAAAPNAWSGRWCAAYAGGAYPAWTQALTARMQPVQDPARMHAEEQGP